MSGRGDLVKIDRRRSAELLVRMVASPKLPTLLDVELAEIAAEDVDTSEARARLAAIVQRYQIRVRGSVA